MQRFDQYMSYCLYDPSVGYYASGAGFAGRRGDFLTSPEVGPLFGECLAQKLHTIWESVGKPSAWNIYDVGSNSGSLLRAIEQSSFSQDSWNCIGVDFNGDITPEAFASCDLEGSMVIMNELLDNLPFRILEKASSANTGWKEIFVGTEGEDGQLRFESQEIARSELERFPAEVQAALEGAYEQISEQDRVPIFGSAHRFLADLYARGVKNIISFDYGDWSTAALVSRGGWLRTYRQHVRGTDPLIQPTKWDITADVAVDQLPTPQLVMTQAEALSDWGIAELVREGKNFWQKNAASPTIEAIRMRSRVTEADALCAQPGLGDWYVCEWG